jgi:hypothetical protein
MGETVSARAWVEQVSRAGFRIEAEARNSLCIWKTVQIGNQIKGVQNQAHALMGELPFWGPPGSMVVEEREIAGALSSRLEFGSESIEQIFWGQVVEMAPEAREWVQEMDRLNRFFDEKVGDEVENDTDILALNATLVELHHRTLEIEEAIRVRKSELWHDKENTRSDFLVVSGREI